MTNKTIQVLGSSCPNCKKFFLAVQRIALELEIDVEVEYIDDIAKIIAIGAMTSPALVVNGDIMLTGGGHSEEKIRHTLLQVSNLKSAGRSDEPSGCSFCSKC